MASSSGKPEPAGSVGHAGATSPEASAGRAEARRERRISELVLGAAAREPEEQQAFLRQATDDDADLLEEVRQRLRQAAELPSSFLDMPAAEVLVATADDADPNATETLPFPASRETLPSTSPSSATRGTSSGTSPVVSAERYELGECLGRGGMSRVFRAFDRQLKRPVALKLLEHADSQTLRRFQREAQLQAKVRHEYVLEIYETGDLDGQPFIAMYYVDGPTLMNIRDDTTLEQKIRLMAQVAEGLDAAHREGLIHRDVKPSNILVETTSDGRLKPRVADFGIATGLSGSSMFTAALAGTPYYIAPEHLHEDQQPVDRRSDLYSLGVTIFQLLTGEPPFHHPSFTEMLRQVREDPPPRLRNLAPSLPAELEAIVTKCLAKDPDARYPTARAVADDLWRFVDGKPVEAHDTTFTYRLARSAVHGRSLPTGALVAGILLITLLAAFTIRSTTRAKRVAFEAQQARQVAFEAEVTLEGLAASYHDQGRYHKAERLYQRVLEIRQRRLGAEHPDIQTILERLASLYDAWGRDGKAAEIRSLLDPLQGRVLPAPLRDSASPAPPSPPSGDRETVRPE